MARIDWNQMVTAEDREAADRAQAASRPVSVGQLVAVLATLLDVSVEKVEAALAQAEALQPEHA